MRLRCRIFRHLLRIEGGVGRELNASGVASQLIFLDVVETQLPTCEVVDTRLQRNACVDGYAFYTCSDTAAVPERVP